MIKLNFEKKIIKNIKFISKANVCSLGAYNTIHCMQKEQNYFFGERNNIDSFYTPKSDYIEDNIFFLCNIPENYKNNIKCNNIECIANKKDYKVYKVTLQFNKQFVHKKITFKPYKDNDGNNINYKKIIEDNIRLLGLNIIKSPILKYNKIKCPVLEFMTQDFITDNNLFSFKNNLIKQCYLSETPLCYFGNQIINLFYKIFNKCNIKDYQISLKTIFINFNGEVFLDGFYYGKETSDILLLAPECLFDYSKHNEKSAVYSIGSIFYYLLTNKYPSGVKYYKVYDKNNNLNIPDYKIENIVNNDFVDNILNKSNNIISNNNNNVINNEILHENNSKTSYLELLDNNYINDKEIYNDTIIQDVEDIIKGESTYNEVRNYIKDIIKKSDKKDTILQILSNHKYKQLDELLKKLLNELSEKKYEYTNLNICSLYQEIKYILNKNLKLFLNSIIGKDDFRTFFEYMRIIEYIFDESNMILENIYKKELTYPFEIEYQYKEEIIQGLNNLQKIIQYEILEELNKKILYAMNDFYDNDVIKEILTSLIANSNQVYKLLDKKVYSIKDILQNNSILNIFYRKTFIVLLYLKEIKTTTKNNKNSFEDLLKKMKRQLNSLQNNLFTFLLDKDYIDLAFSINKNINKITFFGNTNINNIVKLIDKFLDDNNIKEDNKEDDNNIKDDNKEDDNNIKDDNKENYNNIKDDIKDFIINIKNTINTYENKKELNKNFNIIKIMENIVKNLINIYSKSNLNKSNMLISNIEFYRLILKFKNDIKYYKNYNSLNDLKEFIEDSISQSTAKFINLNFIFITDFLDKLKANEYNIYRTLIIEKLKDTIKQNLNNVKSIYNLTIDKNANNLLYKQTNNIVSIMYKISKFLDIKEYSEENRNSIIYSLIKNIKCNVQDNLVLIKNNNKLIAIRDKNIKNNIIKYFDKLYSNLESLLNKDFKLLIECNKYKLFESNKDLKYKDLKYKDLKNKNIIFESRDDISNSLKRIVISMLEKDPSKRPTFGQIKNELYFTKGCAILNDEKEKCINSKDFIIKLCNDMFINFNDFTKNLESKEIKKKGEDIIIKSGIFDINEIKKITDEINNYKFKK